MNVARPSPRRDRFSAQPRPLIGAGRLCARSGQPRSGPFGRFRPRSGLVPRSVRGWVTGLVAAGSLTLQLPTLQAADWEGTPWAGYGREHSVVERGPGPIYRGLDAVAGGIEKLFRLDQRNHSCREAGCDDGCDAATLHALQGIPVEFHGVPAELHGVPVELHGVPVERSPQPELTPSPGRTSLPPSQPSTTQREQPAPPAPPTAIPPTRQRSTPLPPPAERSPGRQQGSIFDSLSDPFEDDSASLRRTRPGGLSQRPASKLRPISETTAPLMRLSPPVRQAATGIPRRSVTQPASVTRR